MHNNIVFWLSAQAKMIISPVVVWLHAGSGGKKFELHLTFGRTKSSVQEVNGWSTASNVTLHSATKSEENVQCDSMRLSATQCDSMRLIATQCDSIMHLNNATQCDFMQLCDSIIHLQLTLMY